MEKLEIYGGKSLFGEIEVSGAKNAVLPILAATLLTDEVCEINRVPRLRDVNTLLQLLRDMGAQADFSAKNSVIIQCKNINNPVANYDLVKTMRASILVLGPLLTRFGTAKVSLPGGCSIGARPVDLHIKGLEAMGAEISISEGYIHAQGKLKGTRFYFDIVSVTGTENLLMAAVLAEGTTILENVAQEPEVSDLAYFLNSLGAKISGIGTSTLVIEGVKSLKGGNYDVLADRIEAGTHLIAAAATKGKVTVTGIEALHLSAVLDKLVEAGAKIERGNNFITIDAQANNLRAVNIRTAPFPAFPTDMQAQFMALNCISHGVSNLTETIFENRFMHVPELERMGAKIRIDGHTAIITGVERLSGAPVMATDLRASACLIIAALAAEGMSTIDRIYHLDRGYEKIEEKLSALGAQIRRISA